jgi:hypothetical protein
MLGGFKYKVGDNIESILNYLDGLITYLHQYD